LGKAVEHIVRRHGDWVRMLGLKSKLEIKEFITQVITRPDDKYNDKYNQDVEYYLRKLNDNFYVS
jgi:hypothetical protein